MGLYYFYLRTLAAGKETKYNVQPQWQPRTFLSNYEQNTSLQIVSLIHIPSELINLTVMVTQKLVEQKGIDQKRLITDEKDYILV